MMHVGWSQLNTDEKAALIVAAGSIYVAAQGISGHAARLKFAADEAVKLRNLLVQSTEHLHD